MFLHFYTTQTVQEVCSTPATHSMTDRNSVLKYFYNWALRLNLNVDSLSIKGNIKKCCSDHAVSNNGLPLHSMQCFCTLECWRWLCMCLRVRQRLKCHFWHQAILVHACLIRSPKQILAQPDRPWVNTWRLLLGIVWDRLKDKLICLHYWYFKIYFKKVCAHP